MLLGAGPAPASGAATVSAERVAKSS
jgi:hypothetical protein